MLIDPAAVFLFDVDNTLLDNDRFGADLGARIEATFDATQRGRYWALYATVRDEKGYADYLETLERLRDGLDDDPRLAGIGEFILDYPFAERLYPGALDVVAACAARGTVVVFSDGDIVLQPRKIVRAGLRDAFDGHVLVCLHKERALDAMQRRYPAPHYVMIDDKPRILHAIKRSLGDRVTTVFVRQGHYALDATASAADPPPDVTIERIADVAGALQLRRPAIRGDDQTMEELQTSMGRT